MVAKPPAPSDLADKFMLRLPNGMRDRIAREAKLSGRSMNAEIVHRLGETLERKDPPTIRIALDAEGFPLSWSELHEHLRAIQGAGKHSAVSMTVTVFTPELLSSIGREAEAELLRKKYKAAAKKKDGLEGTLHGRR